MKRIQRFVTLLAVLSMAVFCIPAFVNAASFEMLKYDFEDDVKPICGAAFALNDTVSYSGAKALKFDPNAADNWGLQIEPALTVGDEYTFAAKIKTVNFKNNGAAWQFWAQQAGAGNKEFADGSNDWTWYTMTFTAQDIANHKFGFFSFGSGTPEGLIYIDDIALGLEADVAAFMTATDAAATEPEPTDPDDESSFMAFDMEDETKLPLTSFDRVSTEREAEVQKRKCRICDC